MATVSTYCVYLILCEKNRLYTGISPRPNARFYAHISGKGARFTKMYPPIEMKIVQRDLDKSAALRLEITLKKLTAQNKRQLWAELPTFLTKNEAINQNVKAARSPTH